MMISHVYHMGVTWVSHASCMGVTWELIQSINEGWRISRLSAESVKEYETAMGHKRDDMFITCMSHGYHMLPA